LPLINESCHVPLASQGYQGLGIHVGDDAPFANKTRSDTGIGFPMVIDWDNSILGAYSRVGEDVALFPLAYLVDKKSDVRNIYLNVEPPLSELVDTIKALLAE